MRPLVFGTSLALGTAAGLVLTRAALGRRLRPRDRLVERRNGLEVRVYGPRVEAQVTVSGSYDDALARGTRILREYLPATTPVCATSHGGRWTIAFTMPDGATCDSLPTPGDPRIRLVERPAEPYAVLRFSGRADRRRVEDRCREASRRLDSSGLRASGEVVVARGAGVPGFGRHEIRIPLASTIPERRDVIPDTLLPT